LKLSFIKNRLSRLVGWDKPDDPPASESGDAPKQQWEKLASRGHQLLAQTRLIAGRSHFYLFLIGVGAALMLTVPFAAQGVATATAASAGWLVKGVETTVSKVTGVVSSIGVERIPPSKAPRVAAIQYIEAKASVDPSQILNIDQVREMMLAWGPLLDKGQPIPAEQCVQDKKIHEEWFGENDARVRCRISADKKRVWAWGWAFASQDPKRRTPYEPEGGGFAAVLYRAAGHEGWTLSSVEPGRRGSTVSMYLKDLSDAAVAEAEKKFQVNNDTVASRMETTALQELHKSAARERFAINLKRVPRSVAADFPELVLPDEIDQKRDAMSPAASILR